ncbi:MAG: zinc-binding dehydrogenase [Leptolyngbyaceae cyanobacterium SM1_3_5]|nr:zinc-binding dehydrogenase [Leptolyngbyaceae cyanobacterium SM1_3_5]
MRSLLAELRSSDREAQIALRQSNRYAARLTIASIAPSRLTISTRGTLENLEWQPMQRRSPDPHEVEIQVQATGLNLIDVLDAIGVLPFDRDGFGVECAGIVAAIGSAVTDLQIGDAVVALAPNSFSEFVTIAAALVVPKPDRLSFEEAATIPANFLTADYALRLANLKAGERILIHAAATGTGLAAVQLAQRSGAEVWATASLGKWELLKSIGVSRIFNSRNLDFADEILHQTNGKGVDVVLNSLSGDFIPKSLAVLKPTGCFLEIGKRDVWSLDRVHQHHPSIDYHRIDLMQIAQQKPDRLQSMLRDLLARFQSGELQPLPRSTFPSSEVAAAFRLMQQAKHTGRSW